MEDKEKRHLFHSFSLRAILPSMQKAILSVVGKDRVGIIAGICTTLAKDNVNILEISQTIMDGFFTMMLVCDTDNCPKEFHELSLELDDVGKKLGVVAKLQREEIFEKMQRI
jgi:ACT domain-containing protein